MLRRSAYWRTKNWPRQFAICIREAGERQLRALKWLLEGKNWNIQTWDRVLASFIKADKMRWNLE
jgi:hypothetical protein